MSVAITFFKAEPHSRWNLDLEAAFSQQFPGARIRSIDVLTEILKLRPVTMAHALFEALMMSPHKFLTRPRRPGEFLLQTPAASRAIKKWVAKNIAPGSADFTFQTQSLFDASREGIPHFIYTDHSSLESLRFPTPAGQENLSPRWIAVEKTAFKSARTMFTTNNRARTSLIEDYGVEPSHVVCIPPVANVIGALSPYDKPFRGVILFVASNWKEKGGPTLLKAFERVLVAHPEAELHIVGCSPLISHHSVKVFGSLPLGEMKARFCASDIFCVPSLFEPSGDAFAEAMHYGLPTVGTRVGAIPDCIEDGETGALVGPNDIDALAKTLTHLLNNPSLCQDMGRSAQSHAAMHFTREAAGKMLSDRISNVLKSK